MRKQQKHVSKTANPKTRSVENSESIPADLIFEISSRLTAKSLSRFRCLSKEWASIFCSRNFAHSFLTRSSARPRLLFTFHVDGKLFSYSAPQPRNPDQDLSHVVVDNHMPIPTRMGSFLIHSPVSGLICPSELWSKRGCNDSKMMMMICNPSAGQFKKLPAARTRRVHVRTYLGYNPIKKEYKVLCMSLSRTYPKISEEHQVLTLGTGKLFWRMIECSLQRCPESGGICINGVLYYSAYQDNCGRTTSLGLMVLDDAEQHKWSKKTYILPPFWKNLGVDTRLNVVGMTSDSEIAFSPSILSDPFYIFYYDAERNTTVKVRVQGIDFVKNQYIYTFIDHAEDVKPMQVLGF
ncbi:PREDICTED: F-box protein At3g49450-like [Brassica oleracea var. oleracea]|uniref:F-box protein At3g49450-like n=1 Tax=Brassica oleracea var. oleracea TaxID=109376 RepID=UPI0006A6D02E|nr:PREDICTED: F-box protein At3g49450-like [Brassica oleracea var. oleracea]